MEEDVSCKIHKVHLEVVTQARDFMPDDSVTYALSDFFKIFSDETRVKILLVLDFGEMCVCDISETLGMSMSAISHQLRMLRNAHLVTSRREGRSIYYSLCDNHIEMILKTALEYIGENR